MKKNYLKPSIEEVRMSTTRLLNQSDDNQPEVKSRGSEEEDVDYGSSNSLWD